MSNTPRTDSNCFKATTEKPSSGDYELEVVYAEEMRKLEREFWSLEEKHAIQLAAISTATIQNTRKTVADRIGRDNPYCSQAYLDVCVAIDREIALREKLQAVELERDFFKEDRNALAEKLGVAREALQQFTDTSMTRPTILIWAKEAVAKIGAK